jgi:hypothetical protein
MRMAARTLAVIKHTLVVFFMGILLSVGINIMDGRDEFKPDSPVPD